MVDEIVAKFIEQFGFWAIIILITFFFYLYLLAFYDAKPNSEISVLWGLIKITKRDVKILPRIIINIVVFLTLIGGLIFLNFYIPSVQITNCPYQISAYEGTMKRLIEAESEAVNTGDISTIKAIFAPDAIIKDALIGKQWNDPIAYYSKNFKEFIYTDAVNYAINRIDIGTQNAIFTSASKGKYTNIKSQITFDYNNSPGTNEWIFKKNSDGCWVISKFTYNILQ
nr:hypothetical protein [Bacteroidota bacterium]